tara:strand:- start:180 stop:515 length:336 start_codon:yes stop_codon:yes gene_type:complete
MVVKTSQKTQKIQKTKVKPIKTDYKYDTEVLSSQEKELNKRLILQYQSTLEQEQEQEQESEQELKEINDCWDNTEESQNTIITDPQNDDYEEQSEEEFDEYAPENYTQQFI